MRKIFSSPQDEVGVILFGCEETKNSLDSPDYEIKGVFEMDGLQIPTWEMLRKLDKVEANKEKDVDWVVGLLAAMHYAREETAYVLKLSLTLLNINFNFFNPGLKNSITFA